MPNDGGRVLDDASEPIHGVYVTGWIKRGPRGVIGTNRACAEQTVQCLLSDFDAGLLERPTDDQASLEALLAESGATVVDYAGWQAIDSAERERGAQTSRPRVKFAAVDEMLSAIST